MPSLTRLLSLLLLCVATLASPAAFACDAGSATGAAARSTHLVSPGAGVDVGVDVGVGQLARGETALVGTPLACIDCGLCASHCMGVFTAPCLPGAVHGPGAFAATTPTATVGIVIAPEPRPPRI